MKRWEVIAVACMMLFATAYGAGHWRGRCIGVKQGEARGAAAVEAAEAARDKAIGNLEHQVSLVTAYESERTQHRAELMFGWARTMSAIYRFNK